MARDGEGVVGGLEGDEDDMLPGMFVSGLIGGYVCGWDIGWTWIADFGGLVDDVDALDEFISQEEAMEMALMETQTGLPARVWDLRSNGPGVLFSDDEYDDIFMGLSEPRGDQCQSQSQDMDMS